MLQHLTTRAGKDAVTITPLTVAELEPWLAGQPAATRRWVEQIGLKAQPSKTRHSPPLASGSRAVLPGLAVNPIRSTQSLVAAGCAASQGSSSALVSGVMVTSVAA